MLSMGNNVYSGSMLDLINNIVEVVLNSYFYWADASLKEDLMQEGYLKAYELLESGEYDPNQNLRNYLFTSIRNTMTNYVYHHNKEKHSSYDAFYDNVECDVPQINMDANYSIGIEQVLKSCSKYKSDYMIGNIIQYMNTLGFDIPNNYTIESEPNTLFMKAIIVDIIWNL